MPGLWDRGLCPKCLFGCKAEIWIKPEHDDRVVVGEGHYASLLRCKKGFAINGDTHEQIVIECDDFKKRT